MSAGRVAGDGERWTLRSVTEEFLALEREMGLLEGPIGRSWEAARFKIHQRLLVLLGTTAEGQISYRSVRPSLAGRAWDFLRNSLDRPSLLSGRADFLFVGHSRRRKTAEGCGRTCTWIRSCRISSARRPSWSPRSWAGTTSRS